MNVLIEFCTELEGALAFEKAGTNATELRSHLIQMQSWLDEDIFDTKRFLKVKDIIYDLEDLFEDIELEMMKVVVTSTSRVSVEPVWSELQKSIDHYSKLHRTSSIPSTGDRLASIVKIMDEILHEINPLFHPSSLPLKIRFHRPTLNVIEQYANCLGLEQLLINNNEGDSCVELKSSGLCSPLRNMSAKFPHCPKLPWYLRRCLNFLNILPTTIRRHMKEDMVLLWIAEGFVQPAHGRSLEDEASDYFDALSAGGYIRSASSRSYDEFSEFYGANCLNNVPENGRHVCISAFTFSDLKAVANPSNLRRYRTLLMFSRQKDPYHLYSLFLRVPNLRVLVLSNVGFKYVPDYVCGLFHLRYLDLSYNPLTTLPDKITNLFCLQTLKLKDCPIESLPKNLCMMGSLRHIYVERCNTPSIGKLTSLQTFENFSVSKEEEKITKMEECKIRELRNLNNLRGKLGIYELENVESLDEAQEARLYLKRHLTSLDLYWSSNDQLDVNYNVLEFLQPHHNLKHLKISKHGNSMFPAWMSDPSFQNLVSVVLNECINQELPSFGILPCLKSLEIMVHGVKHISKNFYGYGKVKVGFPSLCMLTIHMPDMETWFGFAKGDLPKLEVLRIYGCQQLKLLPKMKTLGSLTDLEIVDCAKLESLPKNGLPSSINYFHLYLCPALEEKCDSKEGTEWKKIAYIPSMKIGPFRIEEREE